MKLSVCGTEIINVVFQCLIHVICISVGVAFVFHPLECIMPVHAAQFTGAIHNGCEAILIRIIPCLVGRHNSRNVRTETVFVVGFVCLCHATVYTPAGIEVHGAAEVRVEQSSLNAPTAPFDNEAASAHIEQDDRLALLDITITSVHLIILRITYDITKHINSLPLLTCSVSVGLRVHNNSKEDCKYRYKHSI